MFSLFKLPFKLIGFLAHLLSWPLTPIVTPIVKLLGRFSFGKGSDDAKHRREAERLASTMLNEFHRLGFTRKVATGKKRRYQRQRVKFEYPLLATKDELWCPLDLKSLPSGVRTDDLRDEAVVKSLEDRLHAAVRPDYLANSKLCFVVRLGGSEFPETFGINSFKLDPEAPPLSFPLGMDSAGEHSYADLGRLKHLIIAGATGGGKTTIQHVIINTLISRNTVDDLELWLIDLKGTEFPLYKSLMGSRNKPGMVRHLATEPESAVEVLDLAYKEIRRRNELMENLSATSITDLAQLTGQRLKRIVLIFDEISIMTLDTSKIGKQSIGSWGTFLMAKIAALGRSSGVHIIIGTQMIKKEVLSGLIQANFENRICFSVANYHQSQMVVESSEADGLPVGRAIMRQEGKITEHQTCLISPKQIRLEVARIAEFGPDGGLGDHAELGRFVKDAKLLLQAACEHLEGSFTRDKLLALNGVRGHISQQRFAEISARLERDGVLEAAKSTRPRKVMRGFYGRPGLLDALYGTSNDTQNDTEKAPNDTKTTRSAPKVSLVHPDMSLGHQDALNPVDDTSSDVVCRLEDPTTCAPTGEEPAESTEAREPQEEPELPEVFRRAIDETDKPKKGKRKS